jgi:hypothetical protein
VRGFNTEAGGGPQQPQLSRSLTAATALAARRCAPLTVPPPSYGPACGGRGAARGAIAMATAPSHLDGNVCVSCSVQGLPDRPVGTLACAQVPRAGQGRVDHPPTHRGEEGKGKGKGFEEKQEWVRRGRATGFACRAPYSVAPCSPHMGVLHALLLVALNLCGAWCPLSILRETHSVCVPGSAPSNCSSSQRQPSHLSSVSPSLTKLMVHLKPLTHSTFIVLGGTCCCEQAQNTACGKRVGCLAHQQLSATRLPQTATTCTCAVRKQSFCTRKSLLALHVVQLPNTLANYLITTLDRRLRSMQCERRA